MRDTVECLNSINNLTYDNYKVVVVDNGSTDNSIDVISDQFKSLYLIRNSKNLGYTGGNNIGIRFAMENQAEYIWILNNDTTVEADSLEKMVESSQSIPSVGLVSPVVYFSRQREKIQFCGAIFSTDKRILLKNLQSLDLVNSETLKDPILLWGTALLAKRKLIEKVGYFDENFFAYFEDIDLSLRAVKNGFKNIVVKNAKIYHKDASSSGGIDSPIRTFYWVRNLNLLWRKHLKGKDRFLWQQRYILMSIRLAYAYINKGQYSAAEACFDGAYHGLFGFGGAWNKNKRMPRRLKKSIETIYRIKKLVGVST